MGEQRTTNDLAAIASLPFSALSGPEAGELIRDGLIAEVRELRADLAALREAVGAIPRHRNLFEDGTGRTCREAHCNQEWPCPTELAQREAEKGASDG